MPSQFLRVATRQGDCAADTRAGLSSGAQIAISEVLRVISSASGELIPVFQAILANATHICNAKLAIYGSARATIFALPPRMARGTHTSISEKGACRYSEPESAMAQVARRREVVQREHISKAPTYGMSTCVTMIRLAKARSWLGCQ